MAREWSDEEVQAEIREAVAIVREDRFDKHIRTRLTQKETPDAPTDKAPNSGGSNQDPNSGAPKKSRSLFWGEVPE